MKRMKLGLDTPAEQSRALRMAREAFERASEPDAPEELKTFTLGYLSGIADLATDEGAHALVNDVVGLAKRLK